MSERQHTVIGSQTTGKTVFKQVAGREKRRAMMAAKGEHKPQRSRCQRKARKRRTGGVK